MPSRRRDRTRRPGRRPAYKEPKPVVLIVCEGQSSEPEYLDGVRRDVQNPRVEIEVEAGAGVPRTIVTAARQKKRAAEKSARREKDDNIRYDAVWCVFDVDDHPDVADAKQMARDNEIKVAVSNPCFELWLLLHFREQPGMQHRDTIFEMLKQFVPSYDKHVDFTLFKNAYSIAVLRASRLCENANDDGELGRNPTTNIYELTELIRTI